MRAASQARTLAGSDEHGQYDDKGGQTSMAGFDTSPMVWPGQRPGARSIADTLIVIGRGRLIANTGVAELLQRGSAGVRVRSPQSRRLAELLRAEGAAVDLQGDGALVVGGAEAAAVGELAARHGIALHELVTRHPSLEEAFMDLTRGAVDYQAHSRQTTRAGGVS
jgi:hypothetical protein